MVFRPVYRWSGTRVANPEAWCRLKSLLEGLGLRYALMLDERELPGRQGRHDGWTCFSRKGGTPRPEFAFGPSEESFDLLSIFYPRATLDTIYRNPYPDNRPEGWYSGAPYGPIDLVPLEARGALNDYGGVVFLGWNTYDEMDFLHLLAYLEAGGTLVLTRRHLSTHVARNQPAAPPVRSPALESWFGVLPLHGDRVERRVGKGRVIYFPRDAYPSDPALRASYEAVLHELGQVVTRLESARGWIRGGKDVDFVAYDREDGRLRTLYLLNIDGRKSPAMDIH